MSNWQQQLYDDYQKRRGLQSAAPVSQPQPQIIRQSRKEPNKTEERFRLTYLETWIRDGTIDRYGEHESLKFSIGNGVTLTPDWPAWKDGRLSFYEVKGAHVREDAIVKLKCFAAKYPEHRLWIYQWNKGEWIIQEVLP